jgi:hypothetical protein
LDSAIVSAVVGTVPVVAPQVSYCLRSGSVISTSSSSIANAEGLLKNSNTAGLPSAEAGVIVATVGAASLSLIVPVAEAVPETIVVSLILQ